MKAEIREPHTSNISAPRCKLKEADPFALIGSSYENTDLAETNTNSEYMVVKVDL